MCWRELERFGVWDQVSPRPGPVAHGSGAAVGQTKIKGIEAERKHSGLREDRKESEKVEESPRTQLSCGAGNQIFYPTPLYS